ncbi:MAG: hypothetical protein Q9M33_11695, partial [Robiginitomaculum sp.]|nr:hypothetical protein [Robiginitomaculum sp.]
PMMQVAGRLSAIEFLIEIILANESASWSDDDFNAFWVDALSKNAQLPPKSGPVSVELLQHLGDMTQTSLQRFHHRVAERRASIIRVRYSQSTTSCN